MSGLYRWPSEHYQVRIGRIDRRESGKIPAPWWSYLADPFLWRQDGKLWLLAEQFRYLRNQAVLVAIPLGEDLCPTGGPVEMKLGSEGHASFPLVFAHDGEVYLLPETGSRGGVDLYRCERWPDRWRVVRRILDGIDAADSVPLFHAGRWWLFTSLRADAADGGHRSLGLYFTDDLLDGRWVEHPITSQKLYRGSPYSWGRCAGPIIASVDGGWLRPFQASHRYYGEGMGWMKISTLSETEFQETEVGSLEPLSQIASDFSPHHFSILGDLVTFDVRDRATLAGLVQGGNGRRTNVG